jgi:putative membrane protein
MIAKRTDSKVLLLSAFLLAGAMAVAQDQPGGMQQPNTPQPGAPGSPGAPGAPGSPGSPGGMGTEGSGVPSNMPPAADQAFVRSILESDAIEVQLGQLAQQKSQSDDVKQFGQKMVENRKRLDDQLAPLAKQLEVSQPKKPSKKDKEEISKLESLSGPQFDEEYIRVVVKGHEKDVKNLKSEAQSAQDPNVQRAAQMDEPVIAQHLQAIQQIAQAHNVQTDTADSKDKDKDSKK